MHQNLRRLDLDPLIENQLKLQYKRRTATEVSMSISRRKVIQGLAAVVGVLPALFSATQAQAEEKRRARKGDSGGAGGDLALPYVKPGVGMAVSLNYVEDHAAIKDANLKGDRQGVKFADQKCSGCALYTKVGVKDGKEVGKCTVLPGQLVKGDAWCTSWSKKA